MKKRTDIILAWQPLTPRGVAGFALAPLSRLLIMQAVVALVAAAVVVWILSAHWSPVIQHAIQQMPDSAVIQGGRLQGVQSGQLAGNRFLAVAVDLAREPASGHSNDVQLVLRPAEFRICSLFGCFEFRYPDGYVALLGRTAMLPWWGAREPVLLAAAGAATAAGLMFAWALLAAAYMLVLRLVGYYSDRGVSWMAGWKLGGAALMPGALFLILATILYGAQWLDLVRLALLAALHLIIGWVYLPVTVFFMPKTARKVSRGTNPFGPARG